MALFRGIQEYIALDVNNITLVFDSGNIVNISGNIFLYPPQGHPILYNSSEPDLDLKSDRCIYYKTVGAKFGWGGGGHAPPENFVLTNFLSCILLHSDV